MRVSAVTDHGAYYLYVPATGQLTQQSKLADNVDSAGLSPTRYVHHTARDGLDIAGYLTLPNGHSTKNLPLIVPHGGPYGVRDTLGYDNAVQFLANGGYVALWGATRNPERHRCAVSFAGISDMRTQLDYQSDFLVGTRWRKDWQNTVKGQHQFDLAVISPLPKAADLKVPVMLVHGVADHTVPLRQTTAYDRALTAAGKPHETYIYPGAGHGFDKAKDEKDYLDKLEAFLATYNPA